jgi:hypothetical protein
MRYVCLVYHDESKLNALTDAELDALAADCAAWVGEIACAGHHVSSAGLQSVRTATTVRNRNGKVSVTDGPFAETKEFLGGFTLIEARDLNEAIHIAARHPAARVASIEVRPIFDPLGALVDPLDRKLAAAVRRSGGAHGMAPRASTEIHR